MRLKISIFGEGTNDYGTITGDEQPDHLANKYKGDIQLFTEKILRHLLDREFYIEPYPITKHDTRFSHNRNSRREASWGRRLQRAMNVANNKYYSSALIAVLDDRKERNPSIFRQLDEARQEGYKKNSIVVIIGAAVKEIEAWLIADEKALQKVLNYKDKKYAKPEDIDDPKREYLDIIGRYNTDDLPERILREKIIEYIDIEVLLRLCSKGFKPFFQEVREKLLVLFEG